MVIRNDPCQGQDQERFDELRWLDEDGLGDLVPTVCPVTFWYEAFRRDDQSEKQEYTESIRVPCHPFVLFRIEVHGTGDDHSTHYVPNSLPDDEVCSILSGRLGAAYANGTDNKK